MENKNVGFIILGIAILLVLVIFLFNKALTGIASSGCSMDKVSCPMYQGINQQTYLSFGIVGFLVIIGLVLIFTKPKEKIIIKKIKERVKKLNLKDLDNDEKKAIDLLLKEGKAMFQSALMEKLEMGKVKTTRLLDKLEAKQLIERKRRGMNNLVILKH